MAGSRGLSSLSAEEYFGASLWQLYKSIDSPYKAVLKTLLLEAYSWEYPNPRLLAKDIKQRLHDGEIVSFGLDPYCMMLERVPIPHGDRRSDAPGFSASMFLLKSV